MYTHGICQQVPKQQVQVQVLQTCTRVQVPSTTCLFIFYPTTMLLRALAAASTIPYT